MGTILRAVGVAGSWTPLRPLMLASLEASHNSIPPTAVGIAVHGAAASPDRLPPDPTAAGIPVGWVQFHLLVAAGMLSTPLLL